ncbi:MAG: type II secretion system protein [Epsilonproteobacteria bacterium]|nr:type II secretion system protein [Campylobacterota bacterium]
MMMKTNSKRAFSMVTAIITIVFMATLTALIMNVTSKTLQATSIMYQKEQASLLARSYTELAVLYVSGYERTPNSGCVETINSTFGENGNLYTITSTIKYIGNSANNNLPCTTSNILASWSSVNSGFDQTLSIVIDTYVKYKILDDTNINRDVTFHRRTLQKL